MKLDVNRREVQITEHIMSLIRDHLKCEKPPQDAHHYNRVYEKIMQVLENEFALGVFKP